MDHVLRFGASDVFIGVLLDCDAYAVRAGQTCQAPIGHAPPHPLSFLEHGHMRHVPHRLRRLVPHVVLVVPKEHPPTPERTEEEFPADDHIPLDHTVHDVQLVRRLHLLRLLLGRRCVNTHQERLGPVDRLVQIVPDLLKRRILFRFKPLLQLLPGRSRHLLPRRLEFGRRLLEVELELGREPLLEMHLEPVVPCPGRLVFHEGSQSVGRALRLPLLNIDLPFGPFGPFGTFLLG
mmetsp:Transcript_34001/g.76589  ORF Transcript_34001/g.76589 Transcript_34001/m.76589 type:complete len:235 (+) Transcript_34001:1201-1905(+)